MFFATLSLLILSVLTKRDKDLSVGNIVLAFAAGTCLGGAILGRTPYLMLVPASLFLAYNPLADKFNRNSLPLLLMAIFVISCLAICTPVFLIWKGLVPPYQAIISQGGLKIWHGVLGFSYAGIIAALLVPQWFSMSKKIALALIITFLLFCVLNLLWWKVEYMPLYFFLAGILPASSMKIYPFIISPLLMVFSTYFLITLLIHVLRNRNNSYYLMMAASLVLVLATCVNIKHLFSSRYVAQIAPFLVILLAEKDTQDKYKIFRVLVGIIVGYISLQTYANP